MNDSIARSEARTLRVRCDVDETTARRIVASRSTIAEDAAATRIALDALHDRYGVETLTPGDPGYDTAEWLVRGLADRHDLTVDDAYDWLAGVGWGR